MTLLQLIIITLISPVFCYKFNRNVGTVLFTEIDISRKCWSSENLALLESRKVFQDLLPATEVLHMEDDIFVNVLLEYFYGSFAIVQELEAGKPKHLMLQSMSDVIGGYLHRYVLPLTRRAFYAGTVSYNNAKKLYDLFEELKSFLRTNGNGWAKPEQNFENLTLKIEPLELIPPDNNEACKGLVIYEEKSQQRSSVGKIMIPLPFLDNKDKPAAIAMPFKKHALRNLQTSSAAYILVKFYVAANRCLISKSATKSDINKFARSFHTWLKEDVLPHLKEEKWYPGFGGVLRIIETMKREGITGISGNGDYAIMPHVKVADPKSPSIYDKFNPHAKSIKEKKFFEKNHEEAGLFKPIASSKLTTKAPTGLEPFLAKKTTIAMYITFIIMFIIITLCIVIPGFYILFNYCNNKQEGTRKPRNRAYKKPKKHKKLCPPCASDEECELLCPNYPRRQHCGRTNIEKKKSPLNTFVQIFYTPSDDDANNSNNSFDCNKCPMDIELVENTTTAKNLRVENVYGPKTLASSNMSNTMCSKSAQISLDPDYTLESTYLIKNKTKATPSDSVIVASNVTPTDYSTSSAEEENSSSKNSLTRKRSKNSMKEKQQKYKTQPNSQACFEEDDERTLSKSKSKSNSSKGSFKKDRSETSGSSRKLVTDKCCLSSNLNSSNSSGTEQLTSN